MHARALPALVLSLCISTPLAAEITKAPAQKTRQAIKVEAFAKGLVHPWGMAFLPDGRLLVTERLGRMRLIAKDGRLSPPILEGLPEVAAVGQGGLLDVLLAPDFEKSPYQLEWDDLWTAIRENKPYNEVTRGTEASLVTAMGRMAAHTGQIITRDQILNQGQEFAPDVDKLTLESDAPLKAGEDGKYPVPEPGRKRLREY